MKKILFISILLIVAFTAFGQPLLFNRMYHNYNPANGNRFNQIIQNNNQYLAFGYYEPLITGLPNNYLSITSANIDSLGNLINWIPFIDTAYNFGLSSWSSDIKTNDGGYIVSGRAFKRSNSTYNGFLMKLDSNLNMQWRRYYYDTDPASLWTYPDYAFQALKITPDNGFIAVGIRYKNGGNACGLAVKFDSVGNQQWVQTYNQNYYMSGFNTVVIVPDGYIFWGGYGFLQMITHKMLLSQKQTVLAM